MDSLFEDCLRDAVGDDAASVVCKALSCPASVSVRLNPFKWSAGERDAGARFDCIVRQVPWSPYGLLLDGRPNFTLDPFWHAGAYYVQDSSAMFVGEIFRRCLQQLPAGEDGNIVRVLDLCAAPGGKTAQLLARGAKVTALDVDKERMVRLKNNIKRLNLEQNLQTEVADALEFLAHSNEVFDIIVLDAPCSATGTFRRHPEVLHIKTTDDVKNALVLQEKMLDAVSSYMAKDGILLYCTCSIAKDEGEKQIKRFLERHPEFELLPFEDKELKVVEEKIIDNGVLRTLPYYMKEKGGMDAFFAARLQKKA